MNRTHVRALAVVALMAAVAASLSAAQSWKWRFTFVAPFRSDYWTAIANGAMAASKEVGASTIVTGPVGEVSADLQIQAIDAAIAAKVDGIITMALDPERFTMIIDKAAAAGIPVVLVDTDAPKSRRSAYIGTDNYAAGQEAARLLWRAVGAGAVIGIITGPAEADNQQARTRGFRDAIRSFPGMRIVDTRIGNSEYLLSRDRIQAMLVSQPGITALFGADGYGAIAGAAMVKQLNRAGSITIVGFDISSDVIEDIRSNLIHAVIIQDTYKMGYQAIKVLASIKSGAAPTRPVIYTPFRVVDRKNVDAYDVRDSGGTSP
jgi:ribose transport system substrate-binding protein